MGASVTLIFIGALAALLAVIRTARVREIKLSLRDPHAILEHVEILNPWSSKTPRLRRFAFYIVIIPLVLGIFILARDAVSPPNKIVAGANQPGNAQFLNKLGEANVESPEQIKIGETGLISLTLGETDDVSGKRIVFVTSTSGTAVAGTASIGGSGRQSGSVSDVPMWSEMRARLNAPFLDFSESGWIEKHLTRENPSATWSWRVAPKLPFIGDQTANIDLDGPDGTNINIAFEIPIFVTIGTQPGTPTPTPRTSSPTMTTTVTPSPARTATPTPAPTPSPSPSSTLNTPTPTPAPTPSPTRTATPTLTPSPPPTLNTPTPTPALTPLPTRTATPVPSGTPTPTPTPQLLLIRSVGTVDDGNGEDDGFNLVDPSQDVFDPLTGVDDTAIVFLSDRPEFPLFGSENEVVLVLAGTFVQIDGLRVISVLDSGDRQTLRPPVLLILQTSQSYVAGTRIDILYRSF